MNLSSQKIIITGITGGIAFATAKLLIEQGAQVFVSARQQGKLDQALSELGPQASGSLMDLSDTASITEFFEVAGEFDHLITPAASSTFSPISDMDLVAARQILETKQWGQMLCVHEGVKRISKNGSIILFSGTVTQKPIAGATMFASVGGATEAAARIWAHELAPVRVNTIVPGIIDTPIWNSLMSEEAARSTLDATAAVLPVGRVGTVDDIAKSAAFLIDNGFINGHSLVVDGGHRLI